MRLARLSAVSLFAFVAVLLIAAAPAGATTMPRTYKVLVGAENTTRAVDIMAYFPHILKIHVGDRVRFVQNSNEMHTVTFLGGVTPVPDFTVDANSLLTDPPSPIAINPVAVARVPATGGLHDTTTFVNSGLMGREQGQFLRFTVTFTAKGTYHYVCLVHGEMMSGTVEVVGRSTFVPSPMRVMDITRRQIARKMAKVPAVLTEARSQIKAPVQNADGSMTHFVMLGYSKGQIMLMRFFPRQIDVRTGDKVVWQEPPMPEAPHTVTFLNGTTEPSLIVPVVPQSGPPPVLVMNPDVFFGTMQTALTRTGYVNSGFLPPIPDAAFELTIGAMTTGPEPYLCQLHDTSGMRGVLNVVQ